MGICVRKVKKRKYAKETNTIAAKTPIRAKLCRSTAGLVLEYPTIYKYNKIYIVLKYSLTSITRDIRLEAMLVAEKMWSPRSGQKKLKERPGNTRRAEPLLPERMELSTASAICSIVVC